MFYSVCMCVRMCMYVGMHTSEYPANTDGRRAHQWHQTNQARGKNASLTTIYVCTCQYWRVQIPVGKPVQIRSGAPEALSEDALFETCSSSTI